MSIFFLLLYLNVVASFGIEFCNCGGKVLNAQLAVSKKETHKCCPANTTKGCCGNETVTCKPDNHTSQYLSYNLSLTLSDSLYHRPDHSTVFFESNPAIVVQSNYHYLIKEISSRQILSLIHTLRI